MKIAMTKKSMTQTLSVLVATGTLTAALTATVSANAATFLLDMTRNGVTHSMVVHDFWSGEYPGPVVAIGKSNKGKTTILGSSSMRNPMKDQSCTVSNGLYHPWADRTKTPYEIYTVTGITEYVASKDVEISYSEVVGQTSKLKLAAGEKLTRAVYLGEGFCQYVVGNTQKEIQTDCAEIGDNTDLVKTDYPTHATEQWIKFSCLDGGEAYVAVDDLLTQEGVQEGQIASYGSVKR